ncbi:MAG: hypothetical protein KGZ84_06950 [Erysipelotrichia bacterium]|jgi:hypothetical protein|nr:hypothetical protein [Erysipelotrichia bacterium]
MNEESIAQRQLNQQLKAILTLANALKQINQELKDDDFGSAIIIEYNVIEHTVYKMLCMVPEVKKLRFIKEPDRFGLFKELEALIRAIKKDHVLFQECDVSLYESIKTWIIERNTLTHELLEEDRLIDFDEKSKELALQGKAIVKKLITDLRAIRARARHLDHIQYVHQTYLFSSIMLRFERDLYLNKKG